MEPEAREAKQKELDGWKQQLLRLREQAATLEKTLEGRERADLGSLQTALSEAEAAGAKLRDAQKTVYRRRENNASVLASLRESQPAFTDAAGPPRDPSGSVRPPPGTSPASGGSPLRPTSRRPTSTR